MSDIFSSDFKYIIQTIRKGMTNGSGGEYPENDVEALLAAADKCSPADELFLIADNFSPVRDLELMYRLKIPVRLIICGVEVGGNECWGFNNPKEINEQYLDLARATGGSVHTINKDIYISKLFIRGDTVILVLRNPGTVNFFGGGREREKERDSNIPNICCFSFPPSVLLSFVVISHIF